MRLGTTATAQSIIGDYLTLLGRVPDQAGFNYWADLATKGMSAEDIASAIANTPEAQAYHASSPTTAGATSALNGLPLWLLLAGGLFLIRKVL